MTIYNNYNATNNYFLILKYKDSTGRKWIETFSTEDIHVIMLNRQKKPKEYMGFIYNKMNEALKEDGYMFKDSLFNYLYGITYDTNEINYNYINENVLVKLKKMPLKNFIKKYFDDNGILKNTPIVEGKKVNYQMVNAYLFDYYLCLEIRKDGNRIPFYQWKIIYNMLSH